LHLIAECINQFRLYGQIEICFAINQDNKGGNHLALIQVNYRSVTHISRKWIPAKEPYDPMAVF
jgi:hypothetical protein